MAELATLVKTYQTFDCNYAGSVPALFSCNAVGWAHGTPRGRSVLLPTGVSDLAPAYPSSHSLRVLSDQAETLQPLPAASAETRNEANLQGSTDAVPKGDLKWRKKL